MSAEHPVVLFDGVCNLCNRSVAHIIRNDPKGRFRMASLQSTAGRELVAGHSLDGDAMDTVVLIEKGRVYTKSEAALRIARRLRGPSRFWWTARFVPRPLRDAVYDLVSRYRYRWFGRREECMVPGPGVRDRFLGGGDAPVELEERLV